MAPAPRSAAPVGPMKVPDPLLDLVDQGAILDVVRPLMSGKEAAVYLVETREGVCVAKIYKDAHHRSFRQKADYTEGRQVRNTRQRRAMEKSTRYGREQKESAWQTTEVDMLQRLSVLGIRVPKPILYADGVLLMELVADEDGAPAPRLCDCRFNPEQAARTHRFVVNQVQRMLCAGVIHGDLSEYNVLLAADGPMIIDLPQAVDAAHNRSAGELLRRDVANITAFLARWNRELAHTRYGEEMWSLYERARLDPDTPLTGRWRPPDRRADVRGVQREIAAAAKEARARRG